MTLSRVHRMSPVCKFLHASYCLIQLLSTSHPLTLLFTISLPYWADSIFPNVAYVLTLHICAFLVWALRYITEKTVFIFLSESSILNTGTRYVCYRKGQHSMHASN